MSQLRVIFGLDAHGKSGKRTLLYYGKSGSDAVSAMAKSDVEYFEIHESLTGRIKHNAHSKSAIANQTEAQKASAKAKQEAAASEQRKKQEADEAAKKAKAEAAKKAEQQAKESEARRKALAVTFNALKGRTTAK